MWVVFWAFSQLSVSGCCHWGLSFCREIRHGCDDNAVALLSGGVAGIIRTQSEPVHSMADRILYCSAMKQTQPFRSAAATVALCALALSASLPAVAAEQAGVSAAVRGDVQLTRLPEVIGRQISSGEPIFLTDRILSGPSSGMQILLLDETIFTIGPGSQLTIDEFVYDPDTGAGRVTATVARGVFRFVTGKVAANRPEDMKVKTPFGTIGIRGTIVAGEVTASGADVVLLGPGVETNTAERIGRIEVSNEKGSVVVTRPGFGTSIGGTEAPTAPVQVPPERISALTTSIARPDSAGPADSGGNNNPAPGNQAAPSNQQAGQPAQNSQGNQAGPGNQQASASSGAGFSGQAQAAGIVSLSGMQVAQKKVNNQNSAGQQIVQQIHVQDGVSSISDLNTIHTGKFHFDQTVPLSSGGTYRFIAELDFGARHAGGGNSRVIINSLHADIGTAVEMLSAQSFDELPNGLANFGADSGGPGTVDCASGAGACEITVKATLSNLGGIVAKQFTHEVSISDTVGPIQTDSGAGTATRQPGPAP